MSTSAPKVPTYGALSPTTSDIKCAKNLGSASQGESTYSNTPTPSSPKPPEQTNFNYSSPPVPVPISAGGTIVHQPTKATAKIPIDLEALVELDKIFFVRRYQYSEACMGCSSKIIYKAKDPEGNVMFTAKEDTGLCARQCCSSCRSMDLAFSDKNNKEVIRVKRPVACDCCCVPCLPQSLEVYSPITKLAGTVQQEFGLFVPCFTIKDAQNKTVLRIEGSICTSLCGDPEFQVLSADGSTQVGKISKKWTNLPPGSFTDAENFGISFPQDLDIKVKAVVVGAGFLINYLYFDE